MIQTKQSFPNDAAMYSLSFQNGLKRAIKTWQSNPQIRTVDNLFRVLNNKEITEIEDKIEIWYFVYSILHFLTGETPTMPEIDYNMSTVQCTRDSFTGIAVIVNSNFANKWGTDLTAVTLVSPYPTEIQKLSKDAKCTHSNFHSIYTRAIELRKELKHCQIESKQDLTNANFLLKIFINYAFGMIASKNSPLKFNNFTADKVPFNVNRILRKVEQIFPGHYVYIDTDTIYFNNFVEIKERFFATMTGANFDYHTFDVEPGYQGMFVGRKQYVIQDPYGHLKVKGIKLI